MDACPPQRAATLWGGVFVSTMDTGILLPIHNISYLAVAPSKFWEMIQEAFSFGTQILKICNDTHWQKW